MRMRTVILGLTCFALAGAAAMQVRASGPVYPPFAPRFGTGAPGANTPTGQLYFDTSASPYQGYVYNRTAAAWQTFGSAASGGPCTGTANAVQFNNSGVFGCAPIIDNAGTMDVTGTQLQIAGTEQITVKGGTNYSFAFANANMPAYTSGQFNICGGYGDFGNAACNALTSGAKNVIVGFDAGTHVATGSNNTFVGRAAGGNATASDDSFFGESAGLGETAGQQNTAFGSFSLGGNGGTPAALNFDTALGVQALGKIDGGGQNTAAGAVSCGHVTTGSGNICIGFFAGVGPSGGSGITTGSNNIILQAGTSNSPGCSQVNNANSQFFLCGNTAADTLPIMQCNLVSIAGGNCQFNVPLGTAGYTVASLPAAPPTGARAYVTDATACTFGAAPTGGGAIFCPEVFNGSAWIGG